MTKASEIYVPEFVREVEPIFLGATITEDRDALALVVEAPLVSACQDLFDKNVRTVVSSANARNIRTGFAYITLDCSTMSEENLSVVSDMELATSAIKLPKGGDLVLGLLRFSVDTDTRVKELSRRALEATGLFKLQPNLWAHI